jgi:hypothetical protein
LLQQLLLLYQPFAQLQTHDFAGNIYGGSLDTLANISQGQLSVQVTGLEIHTQKDHSLNFYVILILLSQFSYVNINAWLLLCFFPKMNDQVYSVDLHTQPPCMKNVGEVSVPRVTKKRPSFMALC